MKFSHTVIVISTMMLFACHSKPETPMTTCYPMTNWGEWWPQQQLCTTDTCTTYFPIWKALFLEKNGMSEDYFDQHISPAISSVYRGTDRISYTICYKITIEWAELYTCDQLVIQISDSSLQGGDNLPLNTLLTKDQIQVTLASATYNSYINPVTSITTLHFLSNAATVTQLIHDAHVNTLCFNGIYLDQTTGHPLLGASGLFAGTVRCIYASADLVTGETTSTEVGCAVEKIASLNY